MHTTSFLCKQMMFQSGCIHLDCENRFCCCCWQCMAVWTVILHWTDQQSLRWCLHFLFCAAFCHHLWLCALLCWLNREMNHLYHYLQSSLCPHPHPKQMCRKKYCKQFQSFRIFLFVQKHPELAPAFVAAVGDVTSGCVRTPQHMGRVVL